MGGSKGGSKSSGSTTTIQKADPWIGQTPYLLESFLNAQAGFRDSASNGRAGGAFNPEFYQGQMVASTSPESELAMQMQTQRAMSGSPVMNAAQSELQATIGGDYLNGNPYLDQTFNRAADQMRGRLDSQFAGAGRYGSGAHESAMGDALSGLSNQVYGQNYMNERTNQMRGMFFAPQMAQADYQDAAALGEVGAARESIAQDQINADLQKWNHDAYGYYNAIKMYKDLIDGSYGGNSSSSVSAPQAKGNKLGGVLGGAASGAALGSAFPVVGTAAGAIGGGLLGLFGS